MSGITDDELSEILENAPSNEEILDAVEDAGVTVGKWDKKMIALHIYHAVSNHLEKKGQGLIAQMQAVNKALEDLLGVDQLFMAEISAESIEYSTRIDQWLVDNGYATKML